MTDLLPVHVQRDEDAAMGAAWRRAEAAAPVGATVKLVRVLGRLGHSYVASYRHFPFEWEARIADTPSGALAALADLLEANPE